MKAESEVLHSTYAQALFEYGRESGLLDRFLKDFEKITSIFITEKNFPKVMKAPGIGQEEKSSLLDMIDRHLGFSEDFANFIKLLLHRKRFDILHGIFLKFRDLYDMHKGRIEVDLSVCRKLDKNELDRIRRSLKRVVKKDIMIEEKINEGLVGGVKIQFEDRIYDGSIKKKLERIKETIGI